MNTKLQITKLAKIVAVVALMAKPMAALAADTDVTAAQTPVHHVERTALAHRVVTDPVIAHPNMTLRAVQATFNTTPQFNLIDGQPIR